MKIIPGPAQGISLWPAIGGAGGEGWWRESILKFVFTFLKFFFYVSHVVLIILQELKTVIFKSR